MFGLRLGFDYPAYLLLLGLIPVLAGFTYRRLAPLGRVRRWVAVAIRATVLTAIIFALAGVQAVWVTDRVTVFYLLDQSDSIPAEARRRMLDFAIAASRQHRDRAREDRVGLVAFGREAGVEIPPLDDELPPLRRLDGYLGRTDATNLEAALKLAQAAMPEDSRRRIVIISDGNETLGNARDAIARLAEAGIGVDVLPVPLDAAAEVLVEKIDLPTDIRKGQPVEARVVITNEVDADRVEPVRGRLSVTRRIGSEEQLLLDQAIELQPGKNVFPIRHQIDEPAPYTYEAKFIPDSPADDSIPQNNSATGYTYVRGQGRVLLIRPWNEPAEETLLAEALRNADIEVVVQPSNALFSSIAELQAYDAVILDGVPRSDGDSADAISGFTDEQIEMLVRNTQQLGCGLLMIGGPEALGAGGWTGTALEAAMPVDFRIRNQKVEAVGALAMIMHASEMAQGNHWQKVVARSAIEQMGFDDFAGVLHWDFGGDQWLWGGSKGMLPVGPNRRAMLAAIGRMTPGDMPTFDPAMRMALRGLSGTAAAMRHCIIISDGDPADPLPSTIQAFRDGGISISTVAIASHGPAESRRLESIASDTGGKHYVVNDARALPKIFQREARRIARPLVFEPPGGAAPQVIYPHPLLDGIDRNLPSISGFVLTEVKDNPLAQVLIRSPQPESPENASVLAVWTYGLGRTAVLTTDAGNRWATTWAQWPGYEKFFSQLTRWLMRPTGDSGKFTVSTQARDGEVQVVVNALDQSDEFLNFLPMNASVLDPELKPIPLTMRQTAPGRYVGSFPADSAGNFFVNVIPQPGSAPLTTGVTVPYSDEYRLRETDRALLASLAKVTPRGGVAGEVLEPLDESDAADQARRSNPFRGGLERARSIRDIWPWAVLAACGLFLGDVFVRRVSIGMGWVSTAWGAIRGQPADDAQKSLRLDSLQETKRRVSDALQRTQAASRYETTAESPPPSSELLGSGRRSANSSASANKPDPDAGPESPRGGITPAKEESLSYTERLLAAKRRSKPN